MIHIKTHYFFLILFLLPVLFLQNTGCRKEYSFERKDTVGIIRDTMAAPAPLPDEFPACSLCNSINSISLGQWNFKTGNSFLCGSTTTSGFIGGTSQTDFTLFGPSSCSIDTGLVLSALMPVPLDRDRFNLTSSSAVLYYYDHKGPKDIFTSMAGYPFSVTLQSYIYATGVATGKFSGNVLKADGDLAFIAEGKFKVLIK